MAKLYKLPKAQDGAQLLVSNLEIAESVWQRGKGLLGRPGLTAEQGLWLKPGNNIHTFFMKFSIDCIFVNSKMTVERVFSDVGPFRFVGPVWKSRSVIEVPAGSAQKWDVKVGDQLYVVS